MLRLAVAVVLLANLVFYVWTQGWLDDVVGIKASGDHEPERIARQVRPEQVRILPPQALAASAASNGGGGSDNATSATGAPSAGAAASSATSAASAPSSLAVVARASAQTMCLEAGPFGADEINRADSALRAAMPPETRGSWTTVKLDRGAWIIYMGKYPNRDALLKKADELKRRNVRYEELRSPPALADGLSLGRYDDRASADRALAQLGQQGIHTARVVEAGTASTNFMLRVAAADTALASRLGALKLDVLRKGFAECAKPASSATT